MAPQNTTRSFQGSSSSVAQAQGDDASSSSSASFAPSATSGSFSSTVMGSTTMSSTGRFSSLASSSTDVSSASSQTAVSSASCSSGSTRSSSISSTSGIASSSASSMHSCSRQASSTTTSFTTSSTSSRRRSSTVSSSVSMLLATSSLKFTPIVTSSTYSSSLPFSSTHTSSRSQTSYRSSTAAFFTSISMTTTTSSSVFGTALSTNRADDSKGFSRNRSAIIGVSVAITTTLILAVILFFFAYRRRRRQDMEQDSSSSNDSIATLNAATVSRASRSMRRSHIDGDDEDDYGEIIDAWKPPVTTRVREEDEAGAVHGVSGPSTQGHTPSLSNRPSSSFQTQEMVQTSAPPLFPLLNQRELPPSSWYGGHDIEFYGPSVTTPSPAHTTTSLRHTLNGRRQSNVSSRDIPPVKAKSSFLARLLGSRKNSKEFEDAGTPSSQASSADFSPSNLDRAQLSPSMSHQFSVLRPGVTIAGATESMWIHRTPLSKAEGDSSSLSNPASSFAAPDGLLHPRLIQRMASNVHGSNPSFLDNVDYSRPISGQVHTRVDSTTTFTTSRTALTDNGHELDSPGR